MSNRLMRAARLLITGKADAAALRQIPAISAEEVAEAQSFFPMPKFFIFGHARSGTTLLARLLRLHPDVHCNWQAHFFTRPPLLSGMLADRKFEAWMARPSNRWNRGRDLSPVALRAMSDYILERDAAREGKSVVGDKSPNVLLGGKAVEELLRIYPDAFLIYIVRDGRDTQISHRFQNFIDGEQFLKRADLRLRDAFAEDPAPFLAGERSLFTHTALKRMAQSWADNVTDTHALGRKHFGKRYYSLRYEDLLARPFDMLARTWRFLGVEPSTMEDKVAAEMNENPDADWQQEKAPDLVSALEKGKQGSWNQFFTEKDKEVFKAQAGEALINWGYEDNQDW